MNSCIYGLANDDGVVGYVGQTSNPASRMTSRHPQYRPEEEFVVLQPDPIDLNAAERLWIKFFCQCPGGRHVGQCLLRNRNRGGSNAWPSVHSPLTAEHKARIGDSNRGLERSAETRAKLSLAQTGRKVGSPSEETRFKISQSQIGRVFSEEHRANLSAAQRSRYAR